MPANSFAKAGSRGLVFDERCLPTKVIQHVHHVKDVARMLTIHRRNELAAIDLRRGQDRNGEVRREQFLGSGNERPSLDRQRGAAKDEVHLDLDL
jgi:hypothetical protein